MSKRLKRAKAAAADRSAALIIGAGMALAAAIAIAAQASASPPIVLPGAPGEPSQRITAEQAAELSATSYTAEDVTFMQHMIVHHQQAVDMVALIEDRTDTQAVRLMGERISLTQDAEIALMRNWLLARGESAEMTGMDHSAHGGMDHAGHADMNHGGMDHGQHAEGYDTPVMAGMLSPREMDELAAAQGAEFDRLFLEGMIRHHQGAIDMVGELLAYPDAAEDTQLSEFITHVNADQSAEILRMQNILSELGLAGEAPAQAHAH